MDRTVCPECGARLVKGAEHCDLCGAPQEWAGSKAVDTTPDAEDPRAIRTSPPDADDTREPALDPDSKGAVFCHICGWENPRGSKFCSQCGARLEETIRPSQLATRRQTRPVRPPENLGTDSSTSAEDSASIGRHIAVLVGLAVLIVVALFMITVVSNERPAAEPAQLDGPSAAARAASIIQEHEAIPINEQYQGRVDSLLTAVGSEDTAASLEARYQLVDYFIDIGRIDRAAIEQRRLAEVSDDVSDWRTSGNLLFDWMEVSDPESRTQIALLAIDAYEKVLERQPDDLEARANLGWAYQYDPQNPMEAIRQTNIVLEQDEDHLMANYNKGVFLMRINRLDQALDQFERVKDLAGSESPYYEQADMWIMTIRQSRDAR